MNIEGKIVIEGDKHEVEYEPSGMTGLSTLYLRVKGVPHNTPIYIDQIGDVIEMLERGRRAIQALEAERRWMPFEKPEQLPQTMWALNYSDPILVAILSGKTRFVRDDRYDFVQDRWDSGCVGVTHWMPLPEPPEAEK